MANKKMQKAVVRFDGFDAWSTKWIGTVDMRLPRPFTEKAYRELEEILWKNIAT